MKPSLLILGTIICTGLVQSCSTHHFSEPNPVHTKIVGQLSKHLEPYQLQIDSINGSNSLHLTSLYHLSFTTKRQPFSCKANADQFVTEIMKIVLETIESPENRLYLKEFPVNRQNTTVVIYFIDPQTGKLQQPPYFSRIGCDVNGFFEEYLVNSK